MNAENPVLQNLPSELASKRFVREAFVTKETKGTFKFDEDVKEDMPVFRNLYLEKWTKVREHSRIRVTIELL